ncbi:hypothetical protein C8J57DRAFT_1516987 [Mycena rebaudengoi]|nr:hypothetical protein C8J57DRAFT_1516987 [Mycena rebaudengoi]
MPLNRLSELTEPLDFPHMTFVRTLEIETVIDHCRSLPAEYQSTFTKITAAFPSIEVLTLAFCFRPKLPEIPWWPETSFPLMGAAFSTRTKLVHFRQVDRKLVARGGWPDGEDSILHLRNAMEQWIPGVPTNMFTFSLFLKGSQ